MKKITYLLGAALSTASAGIFGNVNAANAFCVGICPGVRRVYAAPYTYRRPIYAAPYPVVTSPPLDTVRTTCSRNSGSVNVFFRPNYSASVVSNVPIGQQVLIDSFINVNRESWGTTNVGGTIGYIPSINLC